jgi:hypothetical protein
MADTNRSGSRRATQRPPEAPASEINPRVSKYSSIFEAVANLNWAFDQVLHGIERLNMMGFFRDEISNRIPRTCRLMIEELRGWAISDISIEIHETANSHWNRYGIRRHRFEQNTRDPEDVRRELERVKRLDQQAVKKKQTKRAGKSQLEKRP